MKRILIIAVTMSFISLTASAQKVKLREGSLDMVRGVYYMNVRYDYSAFTIGKDKPEAEYVSEKKEEYNKKSAGSGNLWEKAWIADRERRFEPHFREEFEIQSGISLRNMHDAKYTLIFKTTHVEPGMNVGAARKNAEIDGEAWVVETAEPDKILAKMSVVNCSGRNFNGFDFDAGLRIQEAYAAAGRGLGKFIKKQTSR